MFMVHINQASNQTRTCNCLEIDYVLYDSSIKASLIPHTFMSFQAKTLNLPIPNLYVI